MSVKLINFLCSSELSRFPNENKKKEHNFNSLFFYGTQSYDQLNVG